MVDYLLCRPHSMSSISQYTILPKRVESDHRPLHFSLTLPYRCTIKERHNRAAINDNTVKEGTKMKVFKWNHQKLPIYRKTLISDDCKSVKDQLLMTVTNPDITSDKLCELLYTYLSIGINQVSRLKTNNNKSHFPRNNWFNEECKWLKKQVNEYAKNNDISKCPFAETYRNLENEYRKTKQKCKRQYRDKIRQKLEQCHSTNPSSYWKLWKSFKTKSSNNSKLTLEDFNVYFRNQTKPPIISYHDDKYMKEIRDFVLAYNIDSVESGFKESLSEDICNGPITIEEIIAHLGRLKNNKAAGADGIPGEFLKYVTDELCEPLFVLYNSMFDRGDWPSKWAEGIINPVHKKSSVNDPDNYRKITVMPALGKVFESILNSRLAFRNLALSIDDPYQFGFKGGSRTTDNMFILQSIIYRQKFKRKPLYLCFVDFTKAFDYVDRYALYYKLIKRGVYGKLLNIICNMYDKAVCRVKWKGELGEDIDSEYGVLQGGMLSPKLFTEFLYDLKENLESKFGMQSPRNT